MKRIKPEDLLYEETGELRYSVAHFPDGNPLHTYNEDDGFTNRRKAKQEAERRARDYGANQFIVTWRIYKLNGFALLRNIEEVFSANLGYPMKWSPAYGRPLQEEAHFDGSVAIQEEIKWHPES